MKFALVEILEMPLPNKLAQTGGAGSERRRHRICGRCSREERWCWCPGMARHRAKLQGPGPGAFFCKMLSQLARRKSCFDCIY